jgi:hypothetical protein
MSAIDDELALTIYVRVPEGMRPAEQQAIGARMAEAVTAELDAGSGELAGAAVTFASFRPRPDPAEQAAELVRQQQRASVGPQLNRDDLDAPEGGPDA